MPQTRPRTPCLLALAAAAALLAVLSGCAVAADTRPARGVVFEDVDGNGERGPEETGIEGVCVSNGREVVRTDADGRWELPCPAGTILFVCKPTGWMTPVDELNRPRFFYIHKPGGSEDEGYTFAGSAPTGPLPESIDFPLVRQEEPRRFRVILMGDPQAGTPEEVTWFGRDVMAELVGTDAAFGISLGDIAYDDLSLLRPICEMQALAGVPWYAVAGNHDMNYAAGDDRGALETFEREMGPATYAFAYGGVHFLVLDNVVWDGPAGTGKPDPENYHGGLSERQLAFVAGYLETVPAEARVVVAMHIPLHNPFAKRHGTRGARKLLRLLSRFPRTCSFSGHTHVNANGYLDERLGYAPAGGGVHPHHNVGTASGNWWLGPPDELGIPSAFMQDGTPNGYAVATFDGMAYSVRYKVARAPADYQMNIHAPDRVAADAAGEVTVLANVFGGGPASKTRMRVGGGEWRPMRKVLRPDPHYRRQWEWIKANTPQGADHWAKPLPCLHMWAGLLPTRLAAGTHVIEVESTDGFGRMHRGRRPIRVDAGGE